MDLLLKYGADSNIKNKQGNTPLHFAAQRGNYDIVRMLLLNYGADPNIQNHIGDTPLHLTYKSSPHIILDDYRKRHISKIFFEEESKKIKFDINAANQKGDTVLHLATKNRDAHSLIFLLNQEGLAVRPNKEGQTPLHLIANLKHDKENNSKQIQTILLSLIASNADLNAVDHKGNTPLHLAAQSKNQFVSFTLLAFHTKSDIKNKEGKIALDYISASDPKHFKKLKSHYQIANNICKTSFR